MCNIVKIIKHVFSKKLIYDVKMFLIKTKINNETTISSMQQILNTIPLKIDTMDWDCLNIFAISVKYVFTLNIV